MRKGAAVLLLANSGSGGVTFRGTVQMPGGAPITARLAVDTGGGGVLILAAPFIRRHRLLKAFQGLETEQGSGVGGEADFLIGPVAAVEVGGFLRLFKVVFDFPKARLVLEQAK